MKVKFKNEYPPIGKFDEIKLPSFACITGQNGCGKSRFFRAIKEGAFEVFYQAGFQMNSILLFDYMNFFVQQPHNQNGENQQNNHTNPFQSDLVLVPLSDEGLKRLWTCLHEVQSSVENAIRNVLLKGVEPGEIAPLCEQIKEIHTFKKVDFIHSLREVLRMRGVSEDVEELILSNHGAYHERCLDVFNTQGIGDLLQAHVGANIFQVHPETLRGNYSSTAVILGQRFFNAIKGYRVNQDHFERQLVSKVRRDEKETIRKSDLNPPDKSPWDIINDILRKYDCNGYFIDENDIPFPENYAPLQNYSPQIYLTNKITDAKVGISDLSSGEKVLFALAISIYEMQKEGDLPQVLLLDEVGTNLHPSQMGKFIAVIQETFVDKGVRVIIATHSPSTVALMPEGSVFVMRKPEEVDCPIMQSIKNEDAIEYLTEGFMTFNEGVVNITRQKNTIYVEGETDKKYFIRACELLGFSDLLDAVEWMHLDGSGNVVNNYRNLKEVVKVNQSALSVRHIGIVDCDAKQVAKDNERGSVSGKVFLRKLEKHDDAHIEKGIENLFKDDFMEKAREFSKGFIKKSSETQNLDTPDEETTETWEVTDKNGLCEWICTNSKKEDFTQFKEVLDEVRKILSGDYDESVE
ncbi:MAG: AAA family ATPase [Ekhidna sp.]|nr:AAA family ATPase [Ekhidna sp.]